MHLTVLRAGAIPAVMMTFLLGACGGGGGGGGGSGPGDGITTPAPPSPPSPPPPPPPPPPPADPASVAPPSTTSAEYKRNWGLAGVHADAAFNYPATGKGIVIAVIDTGVDKSQPDMQGRFSEKSADIRSSRNALDGPDRHGTMVASVIAANFNGFGTIGTAYEATILGIRADNGTATTCPDDEDGCQFEDTDLTRAIDYAVANGAKVINMSLGGDGRQSNAFEAALARAKAAGVVVTASSGNDSEANPGWPARYASDSRYAGSVMAVGASAPDGSMASFSNRAGVTANGFIVAPGEDIVVDCDGTSCWRVNGTSFSSPQVAAALALLLQAFPNISGVDAVDILFRSAADMGAPGTDAVWGRGMMDLARAFSPLGALAVPTGAGTVQVSEGETAGASSGLAFGDAIAASNALVTIGRDDYQRLFKVDLADMFPAGRGALLGMGPPTTQTASATMPLSRSVKLSLAAQAPLFPDEKLPDPLLDLVRGEAPSSVLAVAEIGKLSLSVWSGQGGVSRPQTDGVRDAFRVMASPERTVTAAYRAGAWSFAAEQGAGERREFLSLQEVDGPSYVAASATWAKGATALSFTGGRMDEPQGPLGSDIAGGSVFAMPAATDFASVGVTHRLLGLTLRGETGLGRTSVEQGMFGLDGAISSQWRLGAYGQCRWLACSRFGLELEQPLRVERGSFSTTLAAVPAGYFDPNALTTRTFGATPSGRQLNLRASWEREMGGRGSLGLRGVATQDNGHQADQGLDFGAAVDWRVRF